MKNSIVVRALSLAVLSTTLMLGACSSDTDGKAENTSSGANSAANSGDNASEVTIKHARGEDTYPVNPERVVAIGPAIDNLLAMGIKPSAVVVSAKDMNAPWRDGKLDGVEIIKQADFKTLPKEEIAAAAPDFIVGDYWTISEDNYTQLSEIAPTLGGIGTEGEGIGWKSQLKELGKIFNKEDKAQEVIDQDEKVFTDAKSELPNIEGKTGVVSQFAQGSFGAVADPKDPGASFIYDLGMKFPEPLTDGSIEVKQGRVTLSPENVSALAADFMVIYNRTGDIAEVEKIPGYSDLPQVKSGATLAGNEAVVAGLNTPTSLSRAWVLEQVKPTLKKLS
ncbi:ABC transporter substrate-binding protein [Corynebacterium aurimucosum]|uniref:ABC transporter substrate-binding protein n=1 Tax=Corynebacterium guaraldiae TaxID=3051103 RepID=A0ABY3CRJ1_9CORY|nr:MULTISPECIES: ABC transporter substrate-binding protein [Corynebacterium]MTD98458.1 ABC transporter substrate-binding protein [Corynebacterium guaraldiae]MTE10080.1 ABC transporter substrate-binding protein [Corynebacterium guaraldiae]OFL60468.1 iron ABC transporter substrate-binding protein [Corynebacterium sp. HMSC065D07]TRX33555.1 ABC transporter substrate-binding protein [Corynebacterium guaraldiae]TRX36633.1 ABC transporter substrate-binding protein [Corynebacterium guaraldiae]